MTSSVAVVWLAGLGGLSLVAYTCALLKQDRAWSTRTVPSSLWRVGTGVAFCAWVHPSLGILAALSGYWLLRTGFPAASGGTFWPVAAGGLLLGLHAPAWTVDVGILTALTVGVVQVVIGLAQLVNLPIFRHPSMIHGTMGHRTGYGIFLALLIPMGFWTDVGWPLTAVYLAGVAMSKSSVAAGAATVGLLIVAPGLWPIIVAGGLLLIASRALKYMPHHYRFSFWKPRHLADSWRARLLIWKEAIRHSRPWPYWLIGHGALSFEAGSRTWLARAGLKENYKEAHNEYVELWYEYGLLGAVAILVWVSQYAWHLSLRDPLTGSLAALLVAALANFPLRVAPVAVVGLLIVIALMRQGPAWAF